MAMKALPPRWCGAGCAGLFADIVNGADVGVIERGGGLGFAAEAREGLGIFGDVIGKNLRATKRCRRVSSAL